MNPAKKKILITGIIGSVLLIVGIVLIIVGSTIKRPVVTYKNSDGTVLAEVKVAVGKTAVYTEKPVSPDKDKDRGYTRLFKGWKIVETGEVVEAVEVLEDKNVEVIAVYEKAIMYYTIKADLAGGELASGEKILDKYTVLDDYEFPTPTKDGYTFLGWFKKGTNVQVEKIEKGSIGVLNLVAKWEENK